MATGGQQHTADNRKFLFRLQILVIDGGLLVLRNILDQSLTSQRIMFSACLNQEKSTITHLKKRGFITQVQYDMLFPAGGKVPTSSDLDITLIISLLRNLTCFGLNKLFDWSVTPAPTDKSKEADICRLKVFRNKISHTSTTTAIQQTEFTALWDEIEEVLVRLSSPVLNIQQTINKFKTCPFDLEEERRIQKEIEKWKDYKHDVDRLKQEMTDVKKDIDGIKENVTDVNKDIVDVKESSTAVKRELEGMNENVTDVQKDLEDVKESGIAIKRNFEGIKENVTDLKKDIEDLKESGTAVNRDLECINENVTDVKKNIEDVKEISTAVKRDLEGIKENVTEVKKDIEDVKESGTAVKRDFEGIKENVIDVKKDIEDVKISGTAVKRDLESIKENVTDVMKDIEDVKISGTAVKSDIEGIKENVTDVKKDLEDVKESGTAVKRDVEGIKENVTDVKKDIEDVKESGTALKRDLEGIKENVTDVKKDFEDVKESNTAGKRDLEGIKENVTDVKKDIEDVKESGTAVKSDLEGIKGNVNDMKKDLEYVQESGTAVKRDLEGIKENVTDVKKDFEDVKESGTVVKRDIEDIKENLTDVKRDVDEIKRQQGADETRQDRQKNGNIVQRFLERRRYNRMKTKLQGDLIKFYRQRCSSIPLSPILEEVETPLAGFYVMPDVVDVKQKSLNSNEDERIPVKSLRKLFSFGNRGQQEMYLSADAGFGKTAFSKYLAVTWCQAHCHDENYACFKKSQLKTLLDFEFLFLIFLRDSPSVCNIDDMIEQQIMRKLPTSALLDEVLRGEKCLIILDGLDEWTHPVNSCGEVSEKIPHGYVRDNCVILTTTRPWKLGVANLKTSQINKKVELVQLSADSTRQLEENAIRKMAGIHDKRVLKSKIRDFNKVIRDRRLEHMKGIPLLLMYIVCLWCNNKPIGNSKHEIYTNIIEFLLSRTSKKNPEVQPSRESSACEIPEYIKSREFCKKYYSLITSLAELAYQALFNKKKLVFNRTVADIYLKADDMKLSLLSGILSESRSKTLIKETIKVSFSHKTMQEFFAAIFISSQSDAQKIVIEKCRNVIDILNMSKTCEFLSGMNADWMCAISNELMTVINEDKITRRNRTRTGYKVSVYKNPLYYIQKMFMSCLQEMPESENIQLCLQDFFIEYNTVHSKQLQRLLKQNKTNIKSLYIGMYNTFSSLREIIDLFSLKDLSHIQKLDCCGDWIKTVEITPQILFPSLQYVTLQFGKWTNDEENLSEKFARVQNLQYLYIKSFKLSHTILETFFNFISGQQSMKELTLDWLYCKEHRGGHNCKRLVNLDLSQNSTLSKLHLHWLPGRLQLNISTPPLVNVTLEYIDLDKSSLLLSRDMLNIESVVLVCVSMSAESLQNFFTVLKNLPQSVTVEMRYISPRSEYRRVKKNIRSSQTFHVIQDDGSGFKFKTIQSSEE